MGHDWNTVQQQQQLKRSHRTGSAVQRASAQHLFFKRNGKRSQVKSGADRIALKQPCAGHKDELLDKVEWNQMKPKFRN